MGLIISGLFPPLVFGFVSKHSQGYAYVEFDSPEVACIVAETIDGYFLYEKQLVCRVLKFDEIHPNLFDGAGIQFKKVNWHGMYRERYNADRHVYVQDCSIPS